MAGDRKFRHREFNGLDEGVLKEMKMRSEVEEHVRKTFSLPLIPVAAHESYADFDEYLEEHADGLLRSPAGGVRSPNQGSFKELYDHTKKQFNLKGESLNRILQRNSQQPVEMPPREEEDEPTMMIWLEPRLQESYANPIH